MISAFAGEVLQRQRKILLDGIHRDQSGIEFLDDVLRGMRKETDWSQRK